jgi:hypothetical protein
MGADVVTTEQKLKADLGASSTAVATAATAALHTQQALCVFVCMLQSRHTLG